MSIIRKSIAIIFLFVAMLIPLFLPASLPIASAQETTEEPDSVTPVATEIPTEAPSEVIPTEETPIATEASPETEAPPEPEQTEIAPEETEDVVSETESPPPAEETQQVTEPITELNDDFSIFNSDVWGLVGWSVDNGVLHTNQIASSASVIGFEPVNFELNAQVLIPENNVLVIAFRSGSSSYRAMLSSNGSSRLYRDDLLLDVYGASAVGGSWLNVAILVANDTIAISTDGVAGIVYTDTPSLTDGRIDFLTDGAVTGDLQIDNLTITTVDPVTVVFPSEYQAPTPVPDSTVTPETTVEPEVTVEAEITPEMTLEPELTPEVTVEAEITPEVTVEPELTPEVTAEAEVSETAIYDKSPDNMNPILDLLLDETNELAASTALVVLEYDGYLIDVNDSVGLEINPSDNVTPAQIERLVIQLGGRPTVIATSNVTAFMPLDSLVALLESPLVESVTQPDVAQSTGNSPSVSGAPDTATYTEGFDMLGVTDWHNTGFTGTGVRVGIIDTGFNTIAAGDPEYACLAGPIAVGVPNNHGLAMIQLICDIAPDAEVFTYEVSASSYAGLANAVYEAIDNQIDVLVITLNMMEVAPGDGTGQQDGDDPYIALNTARNQGMVIFAAAGNSGSSFDGVAGPTDRVERAVTFNVPDVPDDTEVAEINITLSAGDSIVVSWDDWVDRTDGATNASDPANIEDFDIEIRLDPAGTYDIDGYEADDYFADAFGVKINDRNFIFDNPSIQYTVNPTLDLNAEIAGVLRRGCPVLNANVVAGTFDGECSVILTITRVRGDAPVTMQVGVISVETTAVDPEDPRDENQNINELIENAAGNIAITAFNGLNGTTLVTNHAGTIARPADSPDVIAVGAVCANEEANFELIPSSSQGPIYSEFGDPNSQTAPTTFANTKPEILSTSFVTTTFGDADESQCDGTANGVAATGGFGGTSAAAAHAAAMTAVLLSNPAYDALLTNSGVQAIQDYIMNHAVELPLGSQADGLDYLHGAGFFILGSPIFNMANTVNPVLAPELIPAQCSGGSNITLYVGQANAGLIQDGSLSNPFSNINTAIGAAGTGTTCIVVMPGEYVTPFVVDDDNINIFGYNSITTTEYPATIVYVSGQYSEGTQVVDTLTFNINAGAYVDGAANAILNGLTFVHINTENGMSRQAVVFDTATNSTLSESRIGTFTVDGVNYTGWTNGDETPVIVYAGSNNTITENIFFGNVGGVPENLRLESAAISVLNASGAPINITQNTFEGNTATTQLQNAANDYWSTLLYSANSNTNVVGNDFINNTASTVINSRTPDGSALELNIVSNVFLNNTMSLTLNAGDASLDAGALIQIYYTPELTFANNTVVRNNFSLSRSNGAILGLGTPAGSDAAMGVTGDVTFDFINNLVYNNTWTTDAAGIVSSKNATAFGECNSLSGVGRGALQHNWWFGYNVDFESSVPCFFSMVDTFNPNDNLDTSNNDPSDPDDALDTENPLPEFVGFLPSSTLDPLTDPEYYAFAELTPGVFSRAIDYSDITAGANVDLTSAPFNLDADGEQRVTDVIPWEGFTTSNNNPSTFTVDIGAFEFRELTLENDVFDFNNYPGRLTFLEDQGIIAIDLEDRVSGGLGEVTFSVVDLTAPTNYGTQCGVEFTDANNGIYFGTGINSARVFYCPPSDFYTGGSSPIPSLSFTYEVIDEGGQSQQEPVTFIINAVDDISLDDIDAVGPLNYTYIGNLGQTGISLRLRPFVDYDNFRFSERGNADFRINGVTAIDYPFGYGGLNTSGDNIFANPPTFNGDFVEFDLNDTEGVAVISYTATDSHSAGGNGQITVNITVSNISRLPNEPGIYDDSSFAFDYSGTWNAASDTTAINNTLHQTTELNATAAFGIRGSGFTLYLDGQRRGGTFDLEIDIDAMDNFQIVDDWALVAGTTDVYEATVSDANTVFICSTTNIDTRLVPIALTSFSLTDFVIKCDGYTYTDTGSGEYEDGETLTGAAQGVHLVEVVNTNTFGLGVDAFALTDLDSSVSNDTPLAPGVHDIEDLVMRDAFGNDWSELASRSYTNGFAYQLAGPVASPTDNNDVSFLVFGGTGFAIGTTFERISPDYTICVTNMSTDAMTCQDHDYSIATVLDRLTYGVYRPFYGLDPASTYRVDILPTSVDANYQFIIDSVVVFEPTDTTSELVAGVVDDVDIDKLNYGGFAPSSWLLNTRTRGASNETATSINRTVRAPGPYVSFEVHEDIDTIYWSFSSTRPSRQVMICVDRGEGVGTNSSTADTLTNNLVDIDTSHGNCIVVDLSTGEYLAILANGTTTVGANNLRIVGSTIAINEVDFRDLWNDANGTHTVEIFSLYDTAFSVDSVTAIGSTAPLLAGRYEEYTTTFNYFDAALNPVVPTLTESPTFSTYTGTFTQLLGRFARDFGGGVVFTKEVGATISFEFTGTGFAPAFRLTSAAEAVNICWITTTGAPVGAMARTQHALDNGDCQTFDNESRFTTYNALRPILGLNDDTYIAAIQFLGDNFDPAPNRAAEPQMWFDGVVIYDNDLSTLTPMTNGITYDANYLRRDENNTFAYFGDNWSTLEGARARLYNNLDLDTILRGEAGATIAFRVSGANAVTFTLPLGTRNTPLLVCANDGANRECQTINTFGRGFQAQITTYLTEDTTGPFGDYTVTVTALDGGRLDFDAVTPNANTQPMGPGTYDDNDPNIIYDYGSETLITNGGFESDPTNDWTANNGATIAQFTQRYSGVRGLQVTGGTTPSVSSATVSLAAGQTYAVLAYVNVDRITLGTVTVSIDGQVANTNPDRVGTFEPFRFDLPAGAARNVEITFEGTAGSTFYLDDVQIYSGGEWQTTNDRRAYGEYTQTSQTPGASFRFGFTGTGFALNLDTTTTSGEMMVCYNSYNPVTTDLTQVDIEAGNCVTYQNEIRGRADTLRLIDGLASDNYAVLVRDVEDGDSILARTFPTVRSSRSSIAQITIDSIIILDTTVPLITDSGNYGESATDTNSDLYLQLVPSNTWASITGRFARNFSDESYVTVVDANGRQSRFGNGSAALMNLELSTNTSARVILDLGIANRSASDQLLACVDGVDGVVTYDGTDYSIVDNNGVQNCTLIDTMRTSRFISLTPDILPLLGTTGVDRILTLQTLTGGVFQIDGYQVLYESNLTPGFYEENIGNDILNVTGNWVSADNRLYSGGSALEARETNDANGASLSFNFIGTGISIVSPSQSIGGEIDVDLVNTGNGGGAFCADPAPAAGAIDTSADPAIDMDHTTTAYDTAINFVGLPCDEYTITITAQLDLDSNETIVIDAIEIYGEPQSLGSLYDDDERDTNGIMSISYGPNNAWSLLSGRSAINALNQTLHSTRAKGSIATFEIGETINSDGIVIYYDARATTATVIDVCFRNLGDNSLTCNNDIQLDESGIVEVNVPSGNYYATIETTEIGRVFALDAVQVQEGGIREGIHTATDIDTEIGVDGDAETVLTGTLDAVNDRFSLANGESVTFNMTGIAFSLLMENVGTTPYTICVSQVASAANSCDSANQAYPLAIDTVSTVGSSSETVTGLHDNNGDVREVTVQITNTGTSNLLISGVHVLGTNASEITTTAQFENTSAEISYLPFGSLNLSAAIRGNQSGGNEHLGNLQGSIIYFEFSDLSDGSTSDPGFEYVRQMTTRGYGLVEICYGQIADGVNVLATESLSDARTNLQCTDPAIANNTAIAYQVSEAIITDGYCEYGCWATIRNVDGTNMPVDYVRLFDAGSVIQSGTYDDAYPGLNYVDSDEDADITGGSWNPDPVSSRFASSGFVTVATANDTITNDNGPFAWFVMEGTGFGINFGLDANADAIKICYAAGAENTTDNVQANVLDAGVCQTFENENRRATYDAARTIVGLPNGIYTVAVQMLPDNGLPRAHSPARPITMQIDTINIYDTDITALSVLNNDTRYEPSYVNRDTNSDFVYYGDTWTSFEGARARFNSGLNYDQAREHGAGLLFRTRNADGLTLYTNLNRTYSPIRVCVVPISADATTLGDTSLAKCFETTLDGRGFSQALSFRFRDFLQTPASDYMVSIVSLTNGFFPIDAIELTATGAMTEGRYEATDVNLYYDGQSVDYIVNPSMETDTDWQAVVQPEVIHTSIARYTGRFGYSIEGNRGSGIESQPFNLTGATVAAPIRYTAMARVRVESGSARMELVEGGSPLSIVEFRSQIPIAQTETRVWQTLRVDFTLTGDYQDLRLQVVANSGNTLFYVDEVHLFEGGEWTATSNRLYSESHASISSTAGASVSFSFTGTGFEFGTAYEATGGEVQVCYDDDAIFDEDADITEHCFIYQNESRFRRYGVSRSITGLAHGTYYVRIRDAEDGFTVTGRTLNFARNPRYLYGSITLDWVTIFDDVTIPSISSGFFNENAVDSQGEQYLRLYPEDAWESVEGRFARNYSNESYVTALDRRTGRAGRFVSGSTALLSVNVPDDGATVILYTGSTTNFNSTLLLICAGGTTTGEIIQIETLVGNRTLLEFALESETTPSDCVVRNGRDGTAITVGPDDLAALGIAANDVPVSFTPLEPGQFQIDGFQVIQGNVLTPGVYDDFLPDSLLDFDSSGSNMASNDTSRLCDDNTLWCPSKSRFAFGGEQVATQEAGATLSFDITGTGFSVLTEVGTFGAQMRICYTQTPISGEASFPSRAETLNGGNFEWDNSDQDLTLGGVWCDLQTTNTNRLVWPVIQPDRINPNRGNQYGFSYYGLPYGNYSVEVMMFEDLIANSRNSVAIDAIVVFDDYNNLPVMGTANSAAPVGSNVLLTDGFYDDRDAAISFEPAIAWTEVAGRFGPPFGPFNLTETTTTDAGSIMQMRVDGNAVTLFQTLNSRNTADARICVLVTGAVIHCTPEASTSAAEAQTDNPTLTVPWALAVETANFSQQNRRRTYFAPIMFYGLGGSSADLPHTIIIENRQHAYTFSLDAIQVQD